MPFTSMLCSLCKNTYPDLQFLPSLDTKIIKANPTDAKVNRSITEMGGASMGNKEALANISSVTSMSDDFVYSANRSTDRHR